VLIGTGAIPGAEVQDPLLRIGVSVTDPARHGLPATTYPTGWRATRRTDERRAQAGALASIAGLTMSAV